MPNRAVHYSKSPRSRFTSKCHFARHSIWVAYKKNCYQNFKVRVAKLTWDLWFHSEEVTNPVCTVAHSRLAFAGGYPVAHFYLAVTNWHFRNFKKLRHGYPQPKCWPFLYPLIFGRFAFKIWSFRSCCCSTSMSPFCGDRPLSGPPTPFRGINPSPSSKLESARREFRVDTAFRCSPSDERLAPTVAQPNARPLIWPRGFSYSARYWRKS